MEIFKRMKNSDQEQIAFYTDKSVKLRAMLAIHSTVLGPAVGGIRIYSYKDADDAVSELIRLSESMTYKAAAAGLNFGGGYIVVVDQLGMERSEPTFRALGRFIESFQGRFIAGEDIGVTEESMEYMSMETRYITGLPAYCGGSGNHSSMAAHGVSLGLLAAAKHRWGSEEITGRKVLIQGYGRMGAQLAAFARTSEAHVAISDINPDKMAKAKEDGYETIPAGQLVEEKCDILMPCAVESVITPETAQQLQCEIIAGAANNQLLNADAEVVLKNRDILYAPDFVINSGAIIDVSEEHSGAYRQEKSKKKTEQIYDRLLEILKYADQKDISNTQSAIHYALARIETIKKIKGTSLSKGKMALPIDGRAVT